MTHQTSPWQPRPPLNQARRGLAAANAGGRVYAIAGFSVENEPPYDVVEARSMNGTGEWRRLTSVPIPRANCSSASLGGSAYVVGGLGEVSGRSNVLDSVHRFDARTDRWEERKSLPAPRCFAGAAAHDGTLYVVGGADDHRLTNSVVAYSPELNEWTDRRPLPPPRRNLLGLVATGRYLYAVGGFADARLDRPLSSMHRYDPTNDEWQEMKPLNRRRGNFGAAAFGVGGHILVVGGVDVIEPRSMRVRLTTSEVYNVASDDWQTLEEKLPVPRASLACALEDDNTVLAIGGIVPGDGDFVPTDLVQAIQIDV
jgi:N-acetylneuraminic acid mutarotase